MGCVSSMRTSGSDASAKPQPSPMRQVKALVSQNKIRFRKDGFDLDLTYITDRIIAMGFPAEGVEATYRNSMAHVQAFFKKYHEGHFKVFNLCAERSYSPLAFGSPSRVERFGFHDHNAPPLWLIDGFCRSVDEYLNADPANVVAVHCKAGKGRTGLMISAYLLHSGMYDKTSEAMGYYAVQRTHDGEGVTIPSQKRFVSYYEQVLRGNMTFPLTCPVLQLLAVRLSVAPNFDTLGGCDPYIVVYQHTGDGVFDKCFNSRTQTMAGGKEEATLPMQPKLSSKCPHAEAGHPFRMDLRDAQVFIQGDTKLELYDLDFFRDEKMCSLWLHTAFMPPVLGMTSAKPDKGGEGGERAEGGDGGEQGGGETAGVFYMSFAKADLDKACKYTDNSASATFPGNFRLELELAPLGDMVSQAPTAPCREDEHAAISREELQQAAVANGTEGAGPTLHRHASRSKSLGIESVRLRCSPHFHSIQSRDSSVPPEVAQEFPSLSAEELTPTAAPDAVSCGGESQRVAKPSGPAKQREAKGGSGGGGEGRKDRNVNESLMNIKAHSAIWWLKRFFDIYDPFGEGLIDGFEFMQILTCFGCTFNKKSDMKQIEVICRDGQVAFPEFLRFMLDKFSLPSEEGQLSSEQTAWFKTAYCAAVRDQHEVVADSEAGAETPAQEDMVLQVITPFEEVV